jgi:hypothetical protein
MADATDLRQGLASRSELLLILSGEAREGSVSACKALLDELRRDDAAKKPGGGLDDLDNVRQIR